MDYRPDILVAVVLGAVLIAASYFDLRSGEIPNRLSYLAVAAGLVLGFALGGSAGLAVSVLGLLAGLLPMLACWLIGGVGGGDVKLMAAVGAMTNWRFALAVLALSFVAAAVWAFVVMIRRGILIKTVGRILRTLYLATVTRGKAGWPEDAASPKLPFALAIMAGAGFAYLDLSLGGRVLSGLVGW